MKLSNKAYDILKWIALVALNAIGVFYKTASGIWGLPYGEAVMETCAALALCIGALIGVSGATYHAERAKDAEGSYKVVLEENNDLCEVLGNKEDA